MRNKLKSIFRSLATVIIAVAVISTIVKAGNLEPPGSPAATMYALSDIYTRLTTNATSTEGDHLFSPSASPASSMYTLTQIYNAIPTIVANTVKLGTSYLGVAGTLTPDGGTAGVADLFDSKTAHLTADWTLDTGTLNLACNTATFDGTGNLVADAYDGTGTGLNRWCITDSGDAVAGDILSGKISWVDGVAITGSIPTQTLSAVSETVSAGYYNATTLSAVDIDLAAGNILSGKTIFGIAGSVTAGYPYGDTIQSTVLTTAAGAGTYNVSNLSNSVIKSGTTWGVNLGSTGTLTPDGGIAGVADLFNGKTAHLTADWTLDTGTLNLACNTATFDGTGNLVADAYDGTGTGLNRWCITESGDAVASNILSGKIAWVDGVAVSGSMANVGQQIITPSTSDLTITAGYHDGTGYTLGDADLVVGNIKSGVNIFNVVGTLKSLLPDTGQTGCWNATGGVITCGNAPAGQDAEYTASNSGTQDPSFTDNGNETITDNNTNLMWQKCSKGLSGASCTTGTVETNYWADALSYCEGLNFAGQIDWRLPNIKELQSIVNYQNVNPGINTTYFPATQSAYYWSGTTYVSGPAYAWNVNFNNGYVLYLDKDTNPSYVRCVRQ